MTDTAVREYPANEQARIAAIRRYDILDTPPDGAFDRITRLAAELLKMPIALVTIVDSDRIWFKSKVGLDTVQIDREPGLCASAILSDEPWIVEDARQDPRALANPLVLGQFGLQFYAGAPLRTSAGFNLGTLCVIDREPREFSVASRRILEDLAAIVVDELELRVSARMAMQFNDDVVQSLSIARLALDAGQLEHASDRLDDAMSAAKRILSDLGEDVTSLRRET